MSESEEGEFKKRILEMLQDSNENDGMNANIEVHDCGNKFQKWIEDAKKEIFQEMPTDPRLIELTKQINNDDPEASQIVRLWCKLWKWFGSTEVTK